jgi:hypothetical protein
MSHLLARPCIIDADINSITIEELSEALEMSRIKKSPGYDPINIELVKYAELALHCGL